MNIDKIKSVGIIEGILEYKDGHKETITFNNMLLQRGKEALANCLGNRVGDQFDLFISRMLFGDGGTQGGQPKIMGSDRNGLFGTTRVNKPVISSITPSGSSAQVIFTAVVGFDDGNGYALNEMALQLDNGDLYSMATFADLNKTSSFQITFNWSIAFV
jgi:hypothetical protein